MPFTKLGELEHTQFALAFCRKTEKSLVVAYEKPLLEQAVSACIGITNRSGRRYNSELRHCTERIRRNEGNAQYPCKLYALQYDLLELVLLRPPPALLLHFPHTCIIRYSVKSTY